MFSLITTYCNPKEIVELPNQHFWFGVLAFDFAHVVASCFWFVNICHFYLFAEIMNSLMSTSRMLVISVSTSSLACFPVCIYPFTKPILLPNFLSTSFIRFISVSFWKAKIAYIVRSPHFLGYF